MRHTIIAGFIALTIILGFKSLNRAPEVAEVTATSAVENPPPVEVAEVASEPAFTRVQITETKVAEPLTDAEKARATPEAKQVEALLAKYGYDPAAFRVAYGYAYEYQRLKRNIDDGSDAARFHLENCMTPMGWKLHSHVPENPAFIEELRAIPATVFGGQISTGGEWPDLSRLTNR